jgi:hypothetical protein
MRIIRSAIIVVVGFAQLSCSSKDKPLPATESEQELTPEIAKETLLEMMKTDRAKKLGWLDGDVPEKMKEMKIEKEADGWYAWTAFRFNLEKTRYVLVVHPQPDARACTFEYTGSFVKTEGRWEATAPELVSAGLQTGK